MAPNPDLLRTEFLGVTVRFEPVDLSQQDIALFFAGVSDRYGLTRLELQAEGGATLSGADGAEFVLRPNQASSCGVTRLGLGEGRERVAGLLGEAIERYGVAALWIEDVTLVAIWDCEGEDGARRLLAEDVLRFDQDRTALLGDEDLSLGLRAWRRLGDGTLDLSLEPMHAEPARLYLRMAYAQPEPVADLASVLTAVDRLGEYLHGPLASFVLALARR
ncbi:MAG: hypothetical protein QOK40_1283 [Miltoncostaeaceae bacterium]|jgi:hypothetical protein|nr:hypothetical protein [Miltoncostaeaceae bacterium]